MKLGLTVKYLAKKMCTVLKTHFLEGKYYTVPFHCERLPGQAASFQTT